MVLLLGESGNKKKKYIFKLYGTGCKGCSIMRKLYRKNKFKLLLALCVICVYIDLIFEYVFVFLFFFWGGGELKKGLQLNSTFGFFYLKLTIKYIGVPQGGNFGPRLYFIFDQSID